MITPTDMSRLEQELTRLRERMAARRLDADEVWRLIDQTSGMLDQACETQFEDQLALIYSLLNTVWENIRRQDELGDVVRDLTG